MACCLCASSWPRPDTETLTDLLAQPLQVLRAIHRGTVAPEWPQTGLALPWLFTAGKGSPSLLYELRRELAACDQVDILVSFITHSGVRKLLDVLQAASAIGADGQPRTRLRIITTTYTGATEIRARCPGRLPGCQVRISGWAPHRLHAKAWLSSAERSVGLCRQRQSVGRGTDGRTGVDGEIHRARPGRFVRARQGAL